MIPSEESWYQGVKTYQDEKKCVAFNTAERRQRYEEFKSLKVSQLVFGLALVQYFLIVPPSLCFRTVMHILYHLAGGGIDSLIGS